MADNAILIVGLGFTGKLVLQYLAKHPERNTFSLQAGGRSPSKILATVAEVVPAGSTQDVKVVVFDLGNYDDVEKAVLGANVVINCAGPFHRYGTNVVKACALNGKNYVDITGETHWISEMIGKYDFLAFKSGATIVPSSCFDSIPSDLTAYTSVQHLKHILGPDAKAGQSTSAMRLKGGFSGGTLATIFSLFNEVPREAVARGSRPYAISPLKGPRVPDPKFLYSLPLPSSSKPVYGGFFLMSPANTQIVRRTWGLLQSSPPRKDAKSAYGENFSYDEFAETPGRLAGVMLSAVLFLAGALVMFVPPVRWIVAQLLPSAGSGPSESTLKNGKFTMTNITSWAGSPSRKVISTFKGKGDPGYACGSVMVSECALLLLPNSPHRSSLPELGRKGGILTPMTAFGSVLGERLVGTGMFELDVREVGEEGKKTK